VDWEWNDDVESIFDRYVTMLQRTFSKFCGGSDPTAKGYSVDSFIMENDAIDEGEFVEWASAFQLCPSVVSLKTLKIGFMRVAGRTCDVTGQIRVRAITYTEFADLIGWLAVEVMGEKHKSVMGACEEFLQVLQRIYAQGQRVLDLDVVGGSGLEAVWKEKLMRVYLQKTGAPKSWKMEKRGFVAILKEAGLIGHKTVTGEPFAVSHCDIIWSYVQAEKKRKAEEEGIYVAGSSSIDPNLFAIFTEALKMVSTRIMRVLGNYKTDQACLIGLLQHHVLKP